ncbi:MAG: type I-E CRISPR-associated protein Cas5/CasD [marine bacterium B5-7]|nr:MAG: type I-E CRISPR-associated protein Cas5/CasD [marine bacterium B5-7]
MKHYLLLRLYGPMASWGDTAVGDFRPSHSHPSRTAVLGLLAAALGIRRNEEDKLLWLDQMVNVAIRLDLTGEMLRDYHTIQVPPESKKNRYYTRADELNSEKLHTIISQRDYRTDSAASVALYSHENDKTVLEQWQTALRKPALPLYLGRKSCPLALPVDPVIIEADNLKSAFDGYPDCSTQLDALCHHRIPKPDSVQYYWEGEDAGLISQMSYPRHDRLQSRKRWQFSTRIEYYAAYPAVAAHGSGKE